MNPTHIERLGLYAALFGTLLFLFELGFPHFEILRPVFKYIYTILILVASSSLVYRYFQGNAPTKHRSLVFDVLAVLFSVFMLAVVIVEAVDPDRIVVLPSSVGLKFALFLLLFRKLTKIQINYGQTNLNPAQLFILSFLMIIFIGSGY